MFFFFKQKTAYEMRISDWSSDVCSSDLLILAGGGANVVAGDSQAISGAGSASAFGSNEADDHGWNDAGSDTIKTGGGMDTISGGAMAVAAAADFAKPSNEADDGAGAGNDSQIGRAHV